MRAVALVIHDVAAATLPEVNYLLDALRGDRRMPATLLVVPAYHANQNATSRNPISAPPDPQFDRWIATRAAAGDELALHGWSHRDDGAAGSRGWDALRRRHYTAGEGEFAALDAAEARRRLADGIDYFAARGWPLWGFVPPAWLINAAGMQALTETSLLYTSTLRGLRHIPSGRWLASRSIVYSTRSPLRRACSHWWNARLAQRLQRAVLVRIGVHPADARHPAIVTRLRHLLDQALADREPLTKADFVRRFFVEATGAEERPQPSPPMHSPSMHSPSMHSPQISVR